jgi:hypothetical protein
MNQPRRQAYLTLIESLLTCPSEEQTAILQANLELLDDDFAQYLREWATETLPNLDADIAENLCQYFIQFKSKNFKSSARQSQKQHRDCDCLSGYRINYFYPRSLLRKVGNVSK